MNNRRDWGQMNMHNGRRNWHNVQRLARDHLVKHMEKYTSNTKFFVIGLAVFRLAVNL